MKRLLLTLGLLLLAVPAFSQTEPCSVTNTRIEGRLTSPTDYFVRWDPVPGAVVYFIEERSSADPLAGGRIYDTRFTELRISHVSTFDVRYSYTIRALGPGPVECRGAVSAQTRGDAELGRVLRRGILPVAGSAPGAFGARFRTYLRLHSVDTLSGRVIFHPAGQPASDNDPSLRYELSASHPEIVWEDVVEAMGVTGIGSIDIVPDENTPGQLPNADARVYNQASNGIFGDVVELIRPADFFGATPQFQQIKVPAGNFRLNVGVRAIAETVARVTVIGADGTEKARERERLIRAGEMLLGSVEGVYGVAVAPGDTVVITFTQPAIPFYTLTDNQTNDPLLYVQEPSDPSVERYSR